ncbi:cysteine desulfurase family protein [Companilactobacillus metriopterae]|uniref:cysteine desulfurase family protein n=1 Tax=Companilactobacillus metriopterae TaxID=1909267 RepID=UPI00100BA0CF|nr:cysteine desulfurase family protein [Companilactobacillus metriopterae]
MNYTFLDNAATTPMDKEVIEEINDKMINVFGNASSTNFYGRQAKGVLETSRHTIAQSIGAKDTEIVFTSGGTESDNTAIISTALSRSEQGKHIITTAVEHEAVMKSMAYLENLGFDVTYLKPNEEGSITSEQVQSSLTDETILVSVMYGNNETGAINPISEIGELLKDSQALFHVDAVQAYGNYDLDVNDLHVDFLSTSAHKINGPKFIGFLYIRDGIVIPSYLKGGDQETKRRAGTENVPAIAGFAKAVELISGVDKQKLQEKYFGYKKIIFDILRQNDIKFEVNGSTKIESLNQILNIYLPGIERGILLTRLDIDGYGISGGSACTAGSLEPSHVISAMFGEESPRLNESIRISFGKYNNEEEIKNFSEALVKIVKDLDNIN